MRARRRGCTVRRAPSTESRAGGAIGTAGACNAALFAAAMLAAEHPDIAERVKKFRSEQTDQVLAKPDPRKD